MALDEPNDEVGVRTVNEIDIMIAEDVLPFTENHILDYVKDAHGEGFSLAPVDGNDCGDCDCSC